MSKSTEPYVPMPMTCHPKYADMADAIRSHMTRSRSSVVVPEPQAMTASYHASKDSLPVSVPSFPTRVLTIKKLGGPAPYVGDPMFSHRMYEWFAAVDDLGRHVAGDAILTEPMYRHP